MCLELKTVCNFVIQLAVLVYCNIVASTSVHHCGTSSCIWFAAALVLLEALALALVPVVTLVTAFAESELELDSC